jgi:hypothetical protein
MTIPQIINTISNKNIVIPNRDSAATLSQTFDFTKYSLIHENGGNTKLKIYYKSR